MVCVSVYINPQNSCFLNLMVTTKSCFERQLTNVSFETCVDETLFPPKIELYGERFHQTEF